MRILLMTLLMFVCFTQCQVNHKEQKGTQKQKAIVAYDEYTNEMSLRINNYVYDVKGKVFTNKNSYIEYKKEQFYNREIEISVKQGGNVVFTKKIDKNIFSTYYKGNEINNRLIYNCNLTEVKDTSYLFIVIINLCEPETDNCRLFSVSFKRDGIFKITEKESSNSGEE